MTATRTAARSLNWFNVLDNGFVADAGTTWTDNHAAWVTLEALIDVNLGGTIYFPKGKYYTSLPFTSAKAGLHVIGEGSPGLGQSIARGSTTIFVANSQWGMILGTSSSTLTRGFTVERIGFEERNAGQALGGLQILRTNNSTVMECNAGDFTAGAGFFQDGGADFCQYTTYMNCRTGNCLYGYHQKKATGTRWISGYLQGKGDAGVSPIANSMGIYIESGDTFQAYGAAIQGYDQLLVINSPAPQVYGLRCETWTTAAVRLQALCYNGRIEAQGDNSLIANGGPFVGSGIILDSGTYQNDCSVNFTNVQAGKDWVDNSGHSGTNSNRTRGHAYFPKGVGTITKSGPLSAADFTVDAAAVNPPDGIIGADSLNKNLQVQLGGSMYYVAVAPLASRTARIPVKFLSQTTGTTSGTLTVPTGGIAAGNILIVAVTYGLGSTPTITVTDTGSNTYSTDVSANLTTGNTPHAAIISGKISTTLNAGDTVTISFSAGVNYPSASAYAYGNLNQTTWLDQAAGATGTGTALSSGNITTTHAQDILVGAFCTSAPSTSPAATPTLTSGWNDLDGADNSGLKGFRAEDNLVFATGTYAATATATSSNDWAAAIASYKSV